MEFQNLMDFPLWNGSVAHLLDYYRKSIRFCNKHELVEGRVQSKTEFWQVHQILQIHQILQGMRRFRPGEHAAGHMSPHVIMCPSDFGKYDFLAKLMYLQNLVDFQNLMEFQNLMDFPLWNGSVAHLLDYYRKSIRFCNKHELVEGRIQSKTEFLQVHQILQIHQIFPVNQILQVSKIYYVTIRFCKIWFSSKINIPDVPAKSGGLSKSDGISFQMFPLRIYLIIITSSSDFARNMS